MHPENQQKGKDKNHNRSGKSKRYQDDFDDEDDELIKQFEAGDYVEYDPAAQDEIQEKYFREFQQKKDILVDEEEEEDHVDEDPLAGSDHGEEHYEDYDNAYVEPEIVAIPKSQY